jgi:hypothetical protein
MEIANCHKQLLAIAQPVIGAAAYRFALCTQGYHEARRTLRGNVATSARRHVR